MTKISFEVPEFPVINLLKLFKMDTEIVVISLGDGTQDNDYTFYQSGKIKRLYDRHAFSFNNVEWLEANEIDDNTRKRILGKCPPAYLEQVASILQNGNA